MTTVVSDGIVGMLTRRVIKSGIYSFDCFNLPEKSQLIKLRRMMMRRSELYIDNRN